MTHPVTQPLLRIVTACILLSLCAAVRAQFNYDEALVPDYTLPDPLVMNDGSPVRAAEQWPRRRAEILQLFETHVYGRAPRATLPNMRFELLEAEPALSGLAIRKQVRVHFSDAPDGPDMEILIYEPAKGEGPFPLFLLLNFSGNQAVHADPGILISRKWMRRKEGEGFDNHRATEASRGIASAAYPIETVLKRGYAFATIYCGDLDTDTNDGFVHGVHPLFYESGQTQPQADEWTTIGAWAWGLSRAVDYFERDERLDAARVAVLGHSRLGKTSLWAGAQDERFAIVISNNSGCGGAALSRRRFGETVKRINTNFPHWFCDNFNQYNDNEDALPVDQHMLIALMAPRPVYVASATEDGWADPRGEFLAAFHAEPVYQLLGLPGLGVAAMPPADEPVGHTIGYHLRTGRHALTEYDWLRYMDFADRHFNR